VFVSGSGDQGMGWKRAWNAMRELGRKDEEECRHAWLACGWIRGSAGGYWSQCVKCLEVRHDRPDWGRVGVVEREDYG
jgi:hypothetical protein